MYNTFIFFALSFIIVCVCHLCGIFTVENFGTAALWCGLLGYVVSVLIGKPHKTM